MSGVAVEATASSTLWSTFTAKAELLGAAVMRTSSQDTAASLLRDAAAEFACTARAASSYPHVAAALRARASPAGEVVGIGEFAIAETGSVALDERAADRGLCFLAERLWLLVPEQAIVSSLDVGLQRLGQLIQRGSTHAVLMSGPSRTADIERVLTIGVHGPRALVIVVVGSGR
jgi:L-lactate dehydrogenase complex protein LldG